jgi:hypothetical protein
MLQIEQIAHALGGKVYKGQVAAPAPGHKRSDRSLSVKLLSDGDFLVNSHRGEDWRELKAYVRTACGMLAWQPKKKPLAERNVPRPVRLQFLSETLRVCRNRPSITFEQFKLLINDARLASVSVGQYADEFGFGVEELKLGMSAELAHYDADARAKILEITYFERMKLRLRRTGATDVDKTRRARLTADRRNAKKRAKRAAARAVKAARGTHIDPLPGRPSLKSKRVNETTKKPNTETDVLQVIGPASAGSAKRRRQPMQDTQIDARSTSGVNPDLQETHECMQRHVDRAADRIKRVLDALLETKHEIVSRYIVRSVDRHNVEVPAAELAILCERLLAMAELLREAHAANWRVGHRGACLDEKIELTDKAKAWLAENYKPAHERNRPSKGRWQEEKRRRPSVPNS